MKKHRWYKGLGTLMILALALAQVQAEDKRPWKNTTEASLVSTNGNSKGTTTSVKSKLNYDWTRFGIEFLAGGLGSSSGGTVTSEQYNAGERGTYKLTKKNYLYERFGWDKDRFSGIRNRWDSSAGYGRVLLELSNDKLNGELGGGYINEERINAPRNEFASGRAYLKYVRKISETANFNQDAEYIHNFKDSDGYRVNTETALIASVSTHISLKTSFVWKHNQKPTPGAGKNDTITLAALVVNY